MKKIVLNIITAFLSIIAFGQSSVDSVLMNIEQNNTSLAALRKNAEADKIGNKTDLLPANPEIEFNYLWGNPSSIGNRTDIAVIQTFDFPTTYTYRTQISALKNEQAGLEYQKQRMEILHQARLLCEEITYQNALLAIYKKRKYHVQEIAETYKKRLESGETNLLEYNKSQIYLLNISKELETIEIEQKATLSKLAKLNGGTTISFTDSVYKMPKIISDFEEWYAHIEQNNPALHWLKQELAITQKEQQLQKAKNLPKFSAGYMSEKVVGEHFQGVSLGITIPLWENKNTVKYTRAKAVAVEAIQTDAKLQLYNEMKTQHTKAIELQNSITDYRKQISEYNNKNLLQKALNQGEISLGEYLIELTMYYESNDKLLEMEHLMHVAWIELKKFT